MNLPNSTYKVLGLYYNEEINHKVYSDWATELLLKDFYTKNIGRLAGVENTLSKIDLDSLIRKVFEELEISFNDVNFLGKCYTRYILNSILKNRISLLGGLEKLYHFDVEKNSSDAYGNFFSLYYACRDFKEYKEDFSYYWQGATKENIDTICYNQFTKWFAENPLIYK